MHRVVVTGYGAITPLGHDATSTWEALITGTSGVGPITLFDTSRFAITAAAEVKHFDPAAALGSRPARRMDRFEQFANVATQEAITHSGLIIDETNAHRVGLSVSCAFGGLTSMEEQITLLNAEGPRRVDPLGLTRFMTTSPSLNIAHQIQGPSFSVASACATGADGIGLAVHLLRAGVVDVMIAGGADAPITALSSPPSTRCAPIPIAAKTHRAHSALIGMGW